MVQLINQFSVLLIAIPLLILLLFLLLHSPGSRSKQILSVVLLLAAISGYLLLKPGGKVADAGQVEAMLKAAGKPVLLEIYSNY